MQASYPTKLQIFNQTNSYSKKKTPHLSSQISWQAKNNDKDLHNEGVAAQTNNECRA